MVKRCVKCGKTNVRFHKHKKSKDGLKSQCVDCVCVSNKPYNEKNSEKRSLQAQKYKHDHKEWWDNYIAEYRKKNHNKLTLKRRKYFSIPGKRLQDMLSKASKRAEKRNADFNLDFEWLWNKWNKQDERCKLTGLKFDLRTGLGRLPLSPSLDRINSNKGYTKRNTRLVCTHINEALNSYGEPTFYKLCKAYMNQRK